MSTKPTDATSREEVDLSKSTKA
uniref:Uncharacterized protein n=1 Tax=Arundo donax TaxID=35708 RepID=A0A0A9EWL9_ARUDO